MREGTRTEKSQREKERERERERERKGERTVGRRLGANYLRFPATGANWIPRWIELCIVQPSGILALFNGASNGRSPTRPSDLALLDQPFCVSAFRRPADSPTVGYVNRCRSPWCVRFTILYFLPVSTPAFASRVPAYDWNRRIRRKVILRYRYRALGNDWLWPTLGIGTNNWTIRLIRLN